MNAGSEVRKVIVAVVHQNQEGHFRTWQSQRLAYGMALALHACIALCLSKDPCVTIGCSLGSYVGGIRYEQAL